MTSRSSLWVVGALLLVASSARPAEMRGRVLVNGSLTPGGTLEIQVGPESQALPQPQARLYSADGRPYLASVFSMDGVIPLGGPVRRLENVAPGRYVLAMEGGARQKVDVREGASSVVALP